MFQTFHVLRLRDSQDFFFLRVIMDEVIHLLFSNFKVNMFLIMEINVNFFGVVPLQEFQVIILSPTLLSHILVVIINEVRVVQQL